MPREDAFRSHPSETTCIAEHKSIHVTVGVLGPANIFILGERIEVGIVFKKSDSKLMERTPPLRVDWQDKNSPATYSSRPK